MKIASILLSLCFVGAVAQAEEHGSAAPAANDPAVSASPSAAPAADVKKAKHGKHKKTKKETTETSTETK